MGINDQHAHILMRSGIYGLSIFMRRFLNGYAIWDGTIGATATTVDYARKMGRSVLVIDPVKQTEKWNMD